MAETRTEEKKRGFLAPYKMDQGMLVRGFLAVAVMALGFWGCMNLYYIFPPDHAAYTALFETIILGLSIRITYMFLVCAAIFAALGVVVFRLANLPTAAEYLIETEGELKKVSWPPRKEWVNSSLAVLVVIVLFVGYLYLVDAGLSHLLTYLKIGF